MREKITKGKIGGFRVEKKTILRSSQKGKSLLNRILHVSEMIFVLFLVNYSRFHLDVHIWRVL